jgi:hypothetical protein
VVWNTKRDRLRRIEALCGIGTVAPQQAAPDRSLEEEIVEAELCAAAMQAADERAENCLLREFTIEAWPKLFQGARELMTRLSSVDCRPGRLHMLEQLIARLTVNGPGLPLAMRRRSDDGKAPP